MMTYDVAEVTDIGAAYIINFTTKSNMEFVEPGKLYIPVSYSCAKLINEQLEKGVVVKAPKGMERELVPGDLILEEVDELTTAKNITLSKARSLANEHLVAISMMTMFEFITLNNQLVDKGFVITEENRETEYLRMINTAQPEMISMLQRYLDARDSIDEVYTRYNKFIAFSKEVDEFNGSVDELGELYDAYVADIKNPV